MKRSSEARKQYNAAPKRKQRVCVRTGQADRQMSRGSGEGGGADRYWMVCPRCGLGLIETVNGPIRTERCTACGAVWADPEDVKRSWGSGMPSLFMPFRRG